MRSGDDSRLPAVLCHGWLIYLVPDPVHTLALVRVYGATGKQLFSYFSP